jgi:aspartate oxidase
VTAGAADTVDVIVVGAGAAGLFAAIHAGRAGARVPSPPNFRGRLASSAAQPLPPTR